MEVTKTKSIIGKMPHSLVELTKTKSIIGKMPHSLVEVTKDIKYTLTSFSSLCNSEGEFVCTYDKVIHESQMCDGKVDCPEEGTILGKDERYTICPPGDGSILMNFNYFFSVSSLVWIV